MKFQFKIQPFQTEAAEAIVRVFAGQSNRGENKYRRDAGKTEKTLLDGADDDFEAAYRNTDVELKTQELLKNIHVVQTENNIKYSSELSQGLGVVSLDVEMETGTGTMWTAIRVC
jgi:type III restriction enzyme